MGYLEGWDVSECRCGRPTRDEAYACDKCGDDLAKALGDVPWIDEQIDITITRQKGATYDGSSVAGAEVPSPVNWAASDAREHLRGILVLWVRLCAEEHVRSEYGNRGLPTDDLPAISRWLLWRVDGLLLHEAGCDAVDEITSAVAHCHRLIDRPPERHYVGPCKGCKRDLYTPALQKAATCGLCGETTSTEDMQAQLTNELATRLVTAREGATLLSRFGLETKQGTIDKWHERKLITEHGHNAKGHRLYLWPDLRTLAQHAASRVGA